MDKYRIINGIRVFAFNGFDQLIQEAQRTKSILIALNSDKLYYSNEQLKSIINENIGYPDGVGAVWALKRKGLKAVKLAGCELWLEIIKRFPENKYYLVGAEKSVNEEVVRKLKIEYPKIQIVGSRDGFFKEGEETENLVKDIISKQPDFVFVAMGSPKQEYFLNNLHNLYQVPMVGLGGSFNVYSGKVKRAPQWMINMNLETLYRYLFCNIKLFRMKNDFKFLWALLLNKL